MWILFKVPCPTPDGRTARDLYRARVDEVAIILEGDVGLLPVP